MVLAIKFNIKFNNHRKITLIRAIPSGPQWYVKPVMSRILKSPEYSMKQQSYVLARTTLQAKLRI